MLNKMKKPNLYDLSSSLKRADLASSIPPIYYTSNDILRTEIDLVFRNSWVGVGRSDIVSSPGDYITLDIAGQNIILLRDEKCNLRAFANTCRHRNARIINGKGTCKGLRCPFHSWFYNLEGQLISTPNMETITNFKKEEYNLIEYKAEERLGFAFISFNNNVTKLDTHLGNFEEIHSCWPLEKLKTVRRREIIVDCNWKMFLEVFNEYYHLPFVHPN